MMILVGAMLPVVAVALPSIPLALTWCLYIAGGLA